MRRELLALSFCLTPACAPQATLSEVVVRTAESVEPGAYVHIWRGCAGRSQRCREREVARGVVTAVLLSSPEVAFVAVEAGTVVREGDRAVKDDPMYYWHPGDHPPAM